MGIESTIKDGGGRSTHARIEDDALLVTTYTCPPMLPQKNKVWGQMLTADGTTSGSTDLGVDGSATQVPFWVPADDDADIYITRLSIICGYGASAPLYDFVDSGNPLTNGIKISYTDTYGEEITIGNPKNNYSFLRLAVANGIVPTAWEIRNLGASQDYGFIISISTIDLVPPYGIKLDMGTSQNIKILIRDNCTDADTFNCRAFGFERFA